MSEERCKQSGLPVVTEEQQKREGKVMSNMAQTMCERGREQPKVLKGDQHKLELERLTGMLSKHQEACKYLSDKLSVLWEDETRRCDQQRDMEHRLRQVALDGKENLNLTMQLRRVKAEINNIECERKHWVKYSDLVNLNNRAFTEALERQISEVKKAIKGATK